MSTYEQFVLQGKMEGKMEAHVSIAKRLLAKGFTIVQIADLMELSIEDAKKLVEKVQQEENIPKA